MHTSSKLSRIAVAVALSVGLSTAAVAQQTSSGIRGNITGPQGNADAGATITILHIPSGTVREAVVGESGQFSLKGLRVGGPYQIIVDSDRFEDTVVEDVYLTLGEDYNLSMALEAERDIENIVVTGSAISATAFNERGPSATFGLEELEQAPSINRNITDIVRIDPRIYVDESRGDENSIRCAGKSPRFNSFTLDGVRVNDSFGLNQNGYPTERMPFPYDAIEQVAVELAPFDVMYGGFTACNINAVTKSGTNEIHGNVFADYTSDSFRGDSIEGDKVDVGNYSERRYGFTVGGPLIEDKLFFFAAYEKLEGANLFFRGPTGSGAADQVDITQAELDEIASIARDVYQYDPGPIPSSFDNEDEKVLLKLDWNINTQHRMSLTYNYNDGNNFTESDGDNDEFEFANHLYERGAELESWVGVLYSDWTDQFTTEVRVGYLDLQNRQNSVGGTDFGEIRVETDDVDVYLGGDDSRQSNVLGYDLLNLSFRGFYYFDNGHELTFGLERESLDIFNLFVQHTETEIRFDGIENFRNGFADAIYYNNAPSHNPEDAAADWGYALNTAYVQDEFYYGDFTFMLGMRYDWYTSSDRPEENTDFVADYGFSNTETLDGEGLWQPRIGVTYEWTEDTTLRGGLGLYSGGNPNVWISNSFSANNVLQFGQRGRSFGYTDGSRSLFDDDVVYAGLEDGVPNGPGYGIPQELYDAVSGGVGDNFEINYLEPGFKVPSEWKLSLGVTHIFPQQYVVTADLLVSRRQDQAIILRGDLEQVGTTEDGYPQYDSVREPSFKLANSETDSTSLTASIGVAKQYDNGIDFTAGYSYNDAEDVQPMTSAVAFSNYTNRAFFDPQEQVSSTSNYNIRHRFTATLNYETLWFDDYATRFSLFGSLNEGQPYSFAYNGTVDPYGFTPFLDFAENVLEPGAERNSEYGSWWGKLDLRVTQQLPGFSEGHSAQAFFVVDNLTNLLNDDWGILEQVDFPNLVGPGDRAESRVGDASLYEIRVGVEYRF
ncbi:TonB-dependent receptor [Alteromonas sp. ASW11-19]|uniref:TonB-dependent receptor n=1 Tax=Alteromonas salexigens TaxID=2982530 RepID=A0ABT2VKA1_9ALTE|nr:TonB-dependent receptor [Alteromonas salexigens]MCU7553701.1 TonB-dependent receptor [Alteromonas salexigens]